MPSVTESRPGLRETPDEVATVDAAWPLVVAATYTAEPIEGALRFWLGELGLAGRVEFAPYNQILQQLLDPTSEMGRNSGGINLVLVRFEDWARFKPGGWDEAAIRDGADELGEALRGFAERSGTPTIIVAPPNSPRVTDHADRIALLAELEERLQADLLPFDSLHWLGRADLARYPVDPGQIHDEAGDRVGHIPYTNLATSALATAVARRINAIKAPPYKVIALDCDNTLWKGVVGEDGPRGITLGPGMKAFQEFVVARQAAGMVVCLVSKNVEADVLEAFDLRDDFPLRRDHLVAWRVNWEPKAKSLVDLAQELNLGLDSFIFLDDNPVECAEVRAALPQILTIQVPTDEGFADLIRHSWAFDRLKVTEEDRRRTRMYRLNADRTRHEASVTDIGAFLASLDLKIAIDQPADDQWPRVAQLTERTNQFNFSTRRRSETEVRHLARSGLECLRVEVADRFGEYGLVGVLICGTEGDALSIDTMLLSCRVLGRGVEHAMFAHLGRLAVERGLAAIEARFIPSAKNEPAGNFLRSLAGGIGTPDRSGTTYRVAAAEAAALRYQPGGDAHAQLELARTGGKKSSNAALATVPARDKSLQHARIVGELARPEAVLRAVEAAALTGRSLDTPFVAPESAVERELAALWCQILHLDRVGTRDPFDDLGGTSVQAARLFVAIEREFGVRLPMATLLDAPTVSALAERVALAGRGEARQSLRLLKAGTPGGPSLFLVHDGDGEVLLYLNLARRLPDDLAVYGLEPHGHDQCPTVLTTIPAMARHYVEQARSVVPAGPYLLGGLCAGGTIAFEMARQLRKAGRTVGLVALLDAADARAGARPTHRGGRRWQRFWQLLRGQGRFAAPAPAGLSATPDPAVTRDDAPAARLESRLARLIRKAGFVASKLRTGTAYEIQHRIQVRRDAARVREFQTLMSRGAMLPEGYVGPSFRDVYQQAERTFESVGTLDAPVLLVRAGGDGVHYPGDDPLIHILESPLFGWEPRVAGGPTTIEVLNAPGGHGGMLQEPHVAALVGPLQAAIGRALAVEVVR